MSDSATRRLSAQEIQGIFEHSPFVGRMKLEVLSLDHDAQRLIVRMPLAPEYERRAGSRQFHGGAIAALIDIVGDFAIGMLVGGGVPTMNLRIDYLRPGTGTYLDATAVVRKTGRTAAVVDIDVQSAEGKLVAIGRGTYVPMTG